MILSEDSSSDLFGLFCGQEIGRGQYRTVYQHQLEKNRVIKHDTCVNWSNVHEWSIFCEFQHTPLGKWLAPIYWLSPRGIWMIQAKTTPIKIGNYPKRVPAMFADIKPENWGMWRGHPVCHDFGNHSLLALARKPAAAMQQVVWEHHV
jgi:hypothetical protein